MAKFQRIVKMVAFHPFDSAENALENINAVTEHEMTADLRVCSIPLDDADNEICLMFLFFSYQNFIEANMPKGKKSSQFPLGVVSSTQ